MSYVEPTSEKDKKRLAQVNELGKKIALLCDGYDAIVVLNVFATCFCGAVKGANLGLGHAHEAIDAHWESPSLECSIVAKQ